MDKLEKEHKRLESDAAVYNLLQEQLTLSPAYKTVQLLSFHCFIVLVIKDLTSSHQIKTHTHPFTKVILVEFKLRSEKVETLHLFREQLLLSPAYKTVQPSFLRCLIAFAIKDLTPSPQPKTHTHTLYLG